MKVVHNSKFLLCSFCSRLSTDLICNNWTRTLDHTVKRRLCEKIHHGKEADLEKKVVNLVGINNDSFLHGTPPHRAILPG